VLPLAAAQKLGTVEIVVFGVLLWLAMAAWWARNHRQR
jgi:hypothetical protein